MPELRLIAGSGRSGTTWVLDAVAEANALRPVFEPLHPETCEMGRRFGYACLTRDAAAGELRSFFARISANRYHSIWTSYRVRPSALRLSGNDFYSAIQIRRLARKWRILGSRIWSYRNNRRRKDVLVKCIRANLMLDWIRANFDAHIVLLMRHPCAVVESQLRFPEHWDPYRLLARYRADQTLRDGMLGKRAEALDGEYGRAEALAAIWCIENLVPASQAAGNGYCVVFYEELLERPEAEWRRVAEGLGLSSVPAAKFLRQPSQQAAASLQKRTQLDKPYDRSYASWRDRLRSPDRRRIAGVLDRFGVDFYSVSAGRPDVAAFRRSFLPD